MFNRKRASDDSSAFDTTLINEKTQAADTIISSGASFKGILKSDGMIRIDGTVEGAIETTGTVILSKTARVLASIAAQDVQVGGIIKGDIHASNRVEIMKDGRIWGDISAGKLLVNEGAFFRGSSIMNGDIQPPEQLLLDTQSIHGTSTNAKTSTSNGASRNGTSTG